MDKSKIKNQKSLWPMAFYVIFAILLIALIAISLQYFKAKKEIAYLSDPNTRQEIDKKKADELVDKVRKLIMLPEGEPTVATIQDVEKLAETQPFFKSAINGDKVLIYSEQAYIYRESDNKIINVGPVFTDNTPAALQGNNASVDVRNGTKTAGLAKNIAEQLTQNGYQILATVSAANTDYKKTQIVNLKNIDVNALAQALNADVVSELPQGEAPSQADIVIILGQQ